MKWKIKVKPCLKPPTSDVLLPNGDNSLAEIFIRYEVQDEFIRDSTMDGFGSSKQIPKVICLVAALPL
jgi:hypothetical protein